MATKKTSKKKPSTSLKERLRASSNVERIAGFLAITLFFFALYLLISFAAFLFSGGGDQSHLTLSAQELLSNPDIIIQNTGGKWGARISNFFINRGFGLASFGLVYLLIIFALKLSRIKRIPLQKNIGYSLFLIVWSSVALGYFLAPLYEQASFYPGGAYGFFISQWLNSMIGMVGTLFILVASLLACIIIAFENAWPTIKVWLTPKPKQVKQEEEPVLNEEIFDAPQAPVIEPEIESIAKVTENNQPVETIFTDITPVDEQPQDLPFEKTFELGSTPPQNNKQAPAGEMELEVTEQNNEELVDELTQEPMEDYDPTLDLSRYLFPSIDLLEERSSGNPQVSDEELIANKNRIVQTLKNYNIEIVKIKATTGPTITLYEIVPAPGIRISKIKNLEDDIALSLSALGIRIIAPIPGKGTVGIEVPNQKPEVVSMRSIIASRTFQESDFELPVALGKTISNETFAIDLAKMPHMLVAGATGQGKSVGLNAVITSLLYKKHPSQLKFVFIDPKKVELNLYSIVEKHFLAKLPGEEDPIITDVQKVKYTLNSLNTEMDSRYDLLKKAHARNIKEYNKKFISRKLNPENGHIYMPYIVVVIDEFADLIMTAGKEIELPIARIAQLARAVGIHMIIATQRPSTNIITGVIKANFPARIAFRVASMIDSRTILDSPGANQLIGKGDMLVSTGSSLTRVQCAFVDTPEVEAIAHFIGDQPGYPSAFLLPEYYGEDGGEAGEGADLSNRDELFGEAARLVVLNQAGSTSSIQRKFSIGYNRAGRIMDQLEAAGVVGPNEGSKARQVLLQDEYSLEQLLSTIDQREF